MFKKRDFRFSSEITVLAVSAGLLCFSMSYWQYTRYVGKRDYEVTLERQAALGVRTFDQTRTDWSDLLHGATRLRGVFDHERQMVLINRSMHEQTGVKLVTPLKIEGSERHILVDRGFAPYDLYVGDQRELNKLPGLQTVEGILRPSQTKQFFLAPPERVPPDHAWKERWFRLDIAVMGEVLPYELLPVYVEQTNQPGPWPVHNPRAVVPSARHLNYTIQWLSFGTFSLFFGFYLQFRKRPAGKPN